MHPYGGMPGDLINLRLNAVADALRCRPHPDDHRSNKDRRDQHQVAFQHLGIQSRRPKDECDDNARGQSESESKQDGSDELLALDLAQMNDEDAKDKSDFGTFAEDDDERFDHWTIPFGVTSLFGCPLALRADAENLQR